MSMDSRTYWAWLLNPLAAIIASSGSRSRASKSDRFHVTAPPAQPDIRKTFCGGTPRCSQKSLPSWSELVLFWLTTTTTFKPLPPAQAVAARKQPHKGINHLKGIGLYSANRFRKQVGNPPARCGRGVAVTISEEQGSSFHRRERKW